MAEVIRGMGPLEMLYYISAFVRIYATTATKEEKNFASSSIYLPFLQHECCPILFIT